MATKQAKGRGSNLTNAERSKGGKHSKGNQEDTKSSRSTQSHASNRK